MQNVDIAASYHAHLDDVADQPILVNPVYEDEWVSDLQ